MSLNERLIGAGAVACTTDTTDVFGDGSGIALYTMDYDASDASGSYDGTPTNVDFGVEGQINYGARI
jgi:predicted lipoprotein with Yx(FWY)xxD motif